MWYHKANRKWMEARQRVLTAGDIINTLPVTKTGRKRNVTKETYCKVLGPKAVPIYDEDLVSTGDAARGHILEPYAVQEFNNYWPQQMNHWDNTVVYRGILDKTAVGFSPDALDVEEHSEGLLHSQEVNPKEVLEIKSYSAAHHLEAAANTEGIAGRPERWQIAVAMYVCQSIERGYLAFYCPRLQVNGRKFIVEQATRADLKGELEVIDKVVRDWNDFLTEFDLTIDRNLPNDEIEIIQKEAAKLEPMVQ